MDHVDGSPTAWDGAPHEIVLGRPARDATAARAGQASGRGDAPVLVFADRDGVLERRIHALEALLASQPPIAPEAAGALDRRVAQLHESLTDLRGAILELMEARAGERLETALRSDALARQKADLARLEGELRDMSGTLSAMQGLRHQADRLSALLQLAPVRLLRAALRLWRERRVGAAMRA